MDVGNLLSQAGVVQLGGGTLAGIAVGYAAKVAAKWALLMLGLILMGLYLLADHGFLTVNWDAVNHGLEEGSRGLGAWFSAMVTQLSPSLVGFGAGVLMGLKIR